MTFSECMCEHCSKLVALNIALNMMMDKYIFLTAPGNTKALIYVRTNLCSVKILDVF